MEREDFNNGRASVTVGTAWTSIIFRGILFLSQQCYAIHNVVICYSGCVLQIKGEDAFAANEQMNLRRIRIVRNLKIIWRETSRTEQRYTVAKSFVHSCPF